MTDIDFLPADFRRHGAQRYDHLWRLAAVVGVGLLLSGTALAQHCRWRRASETLSATEQIRSQTQRQLDQLGRLQSEVAAAEEQARLLAYLHHPWPRTRILATVLNPLPDQITLERLVVSQISPPADGSIARSVLLDSKAEQERLTRLAPAARDLEDLRKASDSNQTVVTLSGTTSQADVLHQYLGQLSRSPLVAKAELDSLETVEKDGGEEAASESPMQFSATIVLRPGYGQPGGPKGQTKTASNAEATSPRTPADGQS